MRATLAGGLSTWAGFASSAASYDNALIADRALTYVGQWGGNACRDARRSGLTGSKTKFPVEPGRDASGKVLPNKEGDGQCRSFVNCVVWAVSANKQWLGGGGGNYFRMLDQAGTEITSVSKLAKGDVVQSGNGVHTFIIVAPVDLKRSIFNVVDSNHDYKETVSNYDRKVTLTKTVRAFRLGRVVAAPAADINAPDAHDKQIARDLVAYVKREQAAVEAMVAPGAPLTKHVEAMAETIKTCINPDDPVDALVVIFITVDIALVDAIRALRPVFLRMAGQYRRWRPHQPVFAQYLALQAQAADAFLLVDGPMTNPAQACVLVARIRRWVEQHPDASDEEGFVAVLKIVGVTEYKARKLFADINALSAKLEPLAAPMRQFFFACGLSAAEVDLLV